MLKVKIGEQEFSLKQKAGEFTIKEFEKLASVLNDKSINELTRYSEAFVMLGADEDVLDEFDGFSFYRLIREFKNYEMEIGEFTKHIEINGRMYESFTEEFFFKVKDMKLIEDAVALNSEFYVGEMMAILFKDVELTKVEHYDPAHIKHKAKLFRENVGYDVAIPFISEFSSNLIKTLEAFKDE
jgi:hypothetical protein